MSEMTVERTRVTGQVIRYLKDRIEDGTWKPGEKITSENELTRILSVSRASVRHAIQQLIAVGVLESFQGKGTFVKSIPLDQINESMDGMYHGAQFQQLLEYRAMVEVACCRIAAKRISQEGLERLEDIVGNMKKLPGYSDAFVFEDIAFHLEIIRATGNEVVVRSMELVMDEFFRQQKAYNTDRGITQAIRYHEEILNALKEGNGALAARKMQKHLATTKAFEDS